MDNADFSMSQLEREAEKQALLAFLILQKPAIWVFCIKIARELGHEDVAQKFSESIDMLGGVSIRIPQELL